MDNEFSILLVDDDPALIDIMRYASRDSFPEARFLQVHAYSQLEKFFQTLHGYGPRLILLDLDLNDSKDGLDILASLRYDDQTCRVPVIVLTTSEAESDVLETIMLGAASFSTKPSDLTGWKIYLANLRQYWVNTVRVAPVWFSNEQEQATGCGLSRFSCSYICRCT